VSFWRDTHAHSPSEEGSPLFSPFRGIDLAPEACGDLVSVFEPSFAGAFPMTLTRTAPIISFETLRNDLWHAWRQIRNAPGFGGAVILVLAAGLGISTAIFSTVRSVLQGASFTSASIAAPRMTRTSNTTQGLTFMLSLQRKFSTAASPNVQFDITN
jgi:hypothetical protein